MKTWKHMSEDNRKTICSCISHNKKLIEISKIINYDPRAISKEVKKNRKPVDYADQIESKCPKLNRWPYVCTNCKNRYKDCSFVKFIYDSKVAQRKADANLINSRKGIDLDSDEFNKLDAIIKKVLMKINLFIKYLLKIKMLLTNQLLLCIDMSIMVI